MKKRRIAGVLTALMLCVCMLAPTGVNASSRVGIRPIGKKTTSYSKKKTYCYVNGKKINIKKTPTFMKSGCYMGSVDEILKKSSLKVKVVSSTSKELILKYGPNTVKLKNGSKKAVTNGVKSNMGTTAIYGTYTSSGKKRWIVPAKSVCSRLGISYQASGGVVKVSGRTNAAVPVNNTSSGTSGSTSSAITNNKIKIVLDAGHGGSDSGATGNNLAEKNLNLAIVLAAKQYFDKDSKFQVFYTRTADTYPSLTQRCELANNQNADMFICVHINSATASARGTETLWNPNRNAVTAKNGLTSRELAEAMHSSAVEVTRFKDRGLKSRTDLRVLNGTNMPACLIEYGFISNKDEASKMKNNTSLYGKALYSSVVNLMKSKGRY